MTTTDVYAGFVAAIRAVSDPEVILLFGSRVRGDAREDSDFDLLVVASKDNWKLPSRRLEITRLRQALPRNCSIDVLLYTPTEVDEWRGGLNHVIARAFEEGRILYECNHASQLE